MEEDFGKMSYGCDHYRRRCLLLAPCCGLVFSCRHCHNETMSVLYEPEERHEIVRHDISKVLCAVCCTEQQVAQVCTNCGVKMGEYFCEICKFYDDDTSKQQFHCDDCGICRVGGRENYFHCQKCGCCYSVDMRDNHTCVKNSMRNPCPICNEFLFDSVKVATILKCGHSMHVKCYNEMISHNQHHCPICSELIFNIPRPQERVEEETKPSTITKESQYKAGAEDLSKLSWQSEATGSGRKWVPSGESIKGEEAEASWKVPTASEKEIELPKVGGEYPSTISGSTEATKQKLPLPSTPSVHVSGESGKGQEANTSWKVPTASEKGIEPQKVGGESPSTIAGSTKQKTPLSSTPTVHVSVRDVAAEVVLEVPSGTANATVIRGGKKARRKGVPSGGSCKGHGQNSTKVPTPLKEGVETSMIVPLPSTTPPVHKSVKEVAAELVTVEASRDVGKKAMSTDNMWHDHNMAKGDAEFLRTVEKHFPETFVSVKIETKLFWGYALDAFCRVLMPLLVTPVINLMTTDDIEVHRNNLRDLERCFGFNVDWAITHLESIEDLKLNNPLSRELAKLEIEQAHMEEDIQKSEAALVESKALLVDRKVTLLRKYIEFSRSFGSETLELLDGAVGRRLLPMHE